MISIGGGKRKEKERERNRKFAKKEIKLHCLLVSKCIVVKASVNSDGFTFTVSACSCIEM